MYLIKFYSEYENEIKKFLELYYSKNFIIENHLYYIKEFTNPFDIINIISCYIDNFEKFKITLWISLDINIDILITPNNLDDIIKYIYERYPY